MKMPPFAYAKAKDLPELFRLWQEVGDDARLLAGGQTLLATLAFRLSEPSVLIDITAIKPLKGVMETQDAIRIGALTTHAELGTDKLVAHHASLLTQAVPLIAHAAIRNRGTIGGSLAYADPAAELPACILALGATIIAVSEAGERRIPAADFFTGLLTTALQERELIAAIEVPKAGPNQQTSILEIARRSGDYAMAGLALAFVERNDGTVGLPKLVFFGVGDGPIRAATAEKAMDGAPLTPASIATAQAALSKDLTPPPDMHGSSAMKMQLCRTLVARALTPFIRSERAAA
jgi:aerobic carbon-monoxide dehydrogenase medium subunit